MGCQLHLPLLQDELFLEGFLRLHVVGHVFLHLLGDLRDTHQNQIKTYNFIRIALSHVEESCLWLGEYLGVSDVEIATKVECGSGDAILLEEGFLC